jgi:hypothetical protein
MDDQRAIAGADATFAHHEHREVQRGLEQMRETARLAGKISSPDTVAAIDRVLGWFGAVVAPHAAWENAEL